MTDERTIERTLRIEAPPEVVFGFLTDPQLIPQWMGLGAEVDPRPGGIYRCAMARRGIFIRGEFVEVERPHHLVFTWGWEGSDRLVPPGSTRVEFTLRSDGDDTTLLTDPPPLRPAGRAGRVPRVRLDALPGPDGRGRRRTRPRAGPLGRPARAGAGPAAAADE